MRSIVSDNKECFICGSTQWLECHHIYGGSNRKHSTKYGLVVYLCHYCHNEPPNGVHHNRERMLWLRKVGQKKFNEAYPKLDFMRIFGRNYL